jgi:hypothetical protein
VTTTDSSGTGYGLRPDRICDAKDVPAGKSRLQWFNLACFAQPAFGTWGNAGLGVYEDPGINNWNLALAKSTSRLLKKHSKNQKRCPEVSLAMFVEAPANF